MIRRVGFEGASRRDRKCPDEVPEDEVDLFERWILGTGHRDWACPRATGKTLEVGIGTGLNLPYYSKGLCLTGTDLDTERLVAAKARSARLGLPIDLIEADAMDLPFSDGTFDSVVCTYVLCSVPDDRHVINEMSRVLKAGGLLILVDHVRSTVPPIYWAQWIYEFIPSRTKSQYMTRRPAQYLDSGKFEFEAQDRLRAGIVERVVVRKK